MVNNSKGASYVTGGLPPGQYFQFDRQIGWYVWTPGRDNAAGKITDALGNAPSGAVDNLLNRIDPEPIEVAVDITGTFLATDPSDPANSATYVSLDSLGLYPGQSFWMWTTGDWSYGSGFQDENDNLTIAIFVDDSGSFKEPASGTTAPDVVTDPNFPSGNVSDISEDFLVDGLVEVFVPSDATGLMISVNDSYWSDNIDPDGDYGVFIDPGMNATPTTGPTFFAVDKTSTYLYQEANDASASAGATVVDLDAVGLAAGDVFQITRIGDWGFNSSYQDENLELTMVFTDGFQFIDPGIGTSADPVITGGTLETPPTPTDIPEDMLLVFSEFLVVPGGATQLWLGVRDEYFSDNIDYDNDLGVIISSYDPGDFFG